MGTNLTIGLPAASSAFTHNVSYKFGDVSGAIASGIKTSTVWTMPKTLAIDVYKRQILLPPHADKDKLNTQTKKQTHEFFH